VLLDNVGVLGVVEDAVVGVPQRRRPARLASVIARFAGLRLTTIDYLLTTSNW
jgi:hypothetical protein